MAQLERPQRPVNTSKTPPPTIHTMEQLLRAAEGSKLSPTCSPSSSSSSCSSPHSPAYFMRLKHNDMEEGQNQKKSVLTKVKEKAKKLRHSLSKKKQEDGNNTSPSWRGLEDDGVEEDAEYFGAPMYESEKAHEGYKENTRQHPRGSPTITEKHVLSSNDKAIMGQDGEKSLGRTMSMSKRTTQPATATKTVPAGAATTTLPGANKAVAEKLTPSNAEGSEAAYSITSKIQGLAVSKPAEHHTSSSSTAATPNPSLSIAAPKGTPLVKTHSLASSSAPITPPAAPSSAPAKSKSSSPTAQLWDKGVSVKEYLMNKLEPGEDEKALSQVISEAMSPRRTPGDAGVMEKVREAVTSLLRNEEPKKHADTTTTTRASSQTPVSTNNNTARASSQTPISTNNTTCASSQTPVSTNNTTRASSQTAISTNNTARASSQTPVSINNTTRASSQTPVSTNNTTRAAPVSTNKTTRASSQIPVSTNVREVAEEENHGRILQAN